MARLKIAQVATSDTSIRLLLLDQIEALRAMGHEVIAICAPGPEVEKVRSAGVTVETIPMRRELSPIADTCSLLALIRCFRRHRFDVVHTHTPKAGLIGPLAARIAGTPHVVHTIHGLMFHDRMPPGKWCLFWLAERFTATFAHALLSQSRQDVAVAIKTGICSNAQIEWLGNGIDLVRFSPMAASSRVALRAQVGLHETDFVVGSVGRLVYEKGFAELFAAAELLATRRPDLRFLVIGPEELGQSDAVPQQRISTLRQRGTVIFTGWREDMPQCYSMMDVFVLPSHREGIPRAAIEASAMECPVIASDIRGCREVVLGGETGLLVPMRDVAALAAAIEQIAVDRLRSTAMGRAGRAHIRQHFDREQVLARLQAFYSRLADERPRSVRS